jgi:hypothetical protein
LEKVAGGRIAIAHEDPEMLPDGLPRARSSGASESTKFTDLDRLCLSSQCGFASTEEGNILADMTNGRSCG